MYLNKSLPCHHLNVTLLFQSFITAVYNESVTEKCFPTSKYAVLHTIVYSCILLYILAYYCCIPLYTPQGMMMSPSVQVFCITAVESSLVLMGTNTGVILVYDGYERKLKHQLNPLNDSVLCLAQFK